MAVFANNPTTPPTPVLVQAAEELSIPESIVNLPADPDFSGSIDSSAMVGQGGTRSLSSNTSPRQSASRPPVGGIVTQPQPANVQWNSAQDLRARLRVPDQYIEGELTSGPDRVIQDNSGILFPFTPTITVDNKAEYSSQSPLHSNFQQYFYKSSTVGPITVSAKFTVQNEFEGAILLGTIHLLRSLTKMRFGTDPYAGSPPPVCRFDAYGTYMLQNIPVAVASWSHELTDGVDYFSVGRSGQYPQYGYCMVPVISTLNITLNVMYSRAEMLTHNVPDWLSGNLSSKGYL